VLLAQIADNVDATAEVVDKANPMYLNCPPHRQLAFVSQIETFELE
jgi:hypothetical protein